MAQCKAEYHSLSGKDTLAFGSHTLFCTLEELHTGVHEYYGGRMNIVDCRISCRCLRCRDA